MTREEKINMMVEIVFGKTMNWIEETESPEYIERVRKIVTETVDKLQKS